MQRGGGRGEARDVRHQEILPVPTDPGGGPRPCQTVPGFYRRSKFEKDKQVGREQGILQTVLVKWKAC